MPLLKDSLGIWALGPNVTRFVPPGYHAAVTNESMIERTKRAADGIAGQAAVYAALGMERGFPESVARRRQLARL